MRNLLVFVCAALVSVGIAPAQSLNNSNNSNLEVMVATNEMQNGYYILRKASLSDSVTIKVLNAANTTFIGESVKLFNLVQNYLWGSGVVKEKEPPRLAVTNRQGCYGVMGFVLEENGTRVEKPVSGWVDLHKNNFAKDYSYLQSITQLFPHEMGHVIQMYLCTDLKDFEPESESPNIHYFNLTTGYNTAFSEGFAEHFENIARELEPSASVKEGIFKDIENRRVSLLPYISGFKRDFSFPLRVGFYRAITPFWYQPLENLKRFDLVENGKIKYANSTIPNISLSNAILYRNTGVEQNLSKLRNAAQAASTEGVISAFFTELVLSPLNERYLPIEFYKLFVTDSLTQDNIKQKITPLHNQYMKIFKVMHSYVRTNSTNKGQLFDFVDGYCKEFPDEAGQVMGILQKTTGVAEIPESLPEIWILNLNADHKYWVMAQFGLSIPYYSFNLNAADSLDLLTFKDITAKEASEIIRYREQNGFFHSVEDIKKVTGISDQVKSLLISNLYDEKNLPADSVDLDFMVLLYLPLLHIFSMMLIWFIPILVIYLYLMRGMDLSTWKRIRKTLLQLLKFILLGITALLCLAFTGYSWKLFLVIGLIVVGIKVIILRKRRADLKISLITTSLMVFVLLYSMV